MIEMCKMLGLDQEAQADGNDPLGDGAAAANGDTPNYEPAESSKGGSESGATDSGTPNYEKAKDKGAGDANLPKQKGQSANQ
jgi:hypothetical protein